MVSAVRGEITWPIGRIWAPEFSLSDRLGIGTSRTPGSIHVQSRIIRHWNVKPASFKSRSIEPEFRTDHLDLHAAVTATLSVLICTYNRHDMLARCLAALLDRTTAKPDQVVVVNSGDVRADQVVNQFQNRSSIEIKLVKTVNKNLPRIGMSARRTAQVTLSR